MKKLFLILALAGVINTNYAMDEGKTGLLRKAYSVAESAYQSISPNTRQTIGLALMIPSIYALFVTVTNHAEARQKEQVGIRFTNRYILRAMAFGLAAVTVGVASKMILQNNPQLDESMAKSIAEQTAASMMEKLPQAVSALLAEAEQLEG